MLGLSVLSSHDGTCGGRRSLLFRSDIFSALDVIMQGHTHTPDLIRIFISYTRGYAGGLDGRRSQRRIVNIKRVRSNAKS